jgi:hypothetical protein
MLKLSLEAIPELIPYLFQPEWLKQIGHPHHWKADWFCALPGAVQVYLEGVVAGQYPVLKWKEYVRRDIDLVNLAWGRNVCVYQNMILPEPLWQHWKGLCGEEIQRSHEQWMHISEPTYVERQVHALQQWKETNQTSEALCTLYERLRSINRVHSMNQLALARLWCQRLDWFVTT